MLKRRLLTTLFALSPLLAAPSAMANGPSFLWDNQEGFITADHCSLSVANETRFAVVQLDHLNELRLEGEDGQEQGLLRDGTLVKILPEQNDGEMVMVEVISDFTENDSDERWLAKPLDRGMILSQHLAAPEEFVFEQKNNGDFILPSPVSDDLAIQADVFSIQGSESYLQIDCPDFSEGRDYLLFNVYDNRKPDYVSARVAVHWDETEIFREVMAKEKEAVSESLTSLAQDDLAIREEVQLQQVAQEQRVRNSIFDTIFRRNIDDDFSNLTLKEENSDVETQKGLNQVVCVQGGTLNVRNGDLDTVLFRASRGEKVKIRQDWDNDKREVTISGTNYEFVQVEFYNRESNDNREGWVATNFIQAESDCPYISEFDVDRTVDTQIDGLDDPECCEFPTVRQATHPYTSGMQMFGARRGGGTRAHAAADIYRYEDEPILSVAPGSVIRDLYYFYQGTYALEVVHSGGFVVRYGEVNSKVPRGVRSGSSVKMGQRIGHMGLVNSGCCRPMLHFELFEGTRSGALSQPGTRFQRRADLKNPTPYLLRWEDEKFQ